MRRVLSAVAAFVFALGAAGLAARSPSRGPPPPRAAERFGFTVLAPDDSLHDAEHAARRGETVNVAPTDPPGTGDRRGARGAAGVPSRGAALRIGPAAVTFGVFPRFGLARRSATG